MRIDPSLVFFIPSQHPAPRRAGLRLRQQDLPPASDQYIARSTLQLCPRVASTRPRALRPQWDGIEQPHPSLPAQSLDIGAGEHPGTRPHTARASGHHRESVPKPPALSQTMHAIVSRDTPKPRVPTSRCTHQEVEEVEYVLLRPPMSLRDPSRSWSVLSAMRGGVDDRGCTYERMVYRQRVVALSHAPKLGARGQSPHQPPAAWVHMRPCAHDPECGHGARVVYMRLA